MYNHHIFFKPSLLKLFYILGINIVFFLIIIKLEFDFYLKIIILTLILFNLALDLQKSKFFNFNFPKLITGETIISLDIRLKDKKYFITTNNRTYEEIKLTKIKSVISGFLVLIELKTEDGFKYKIYVWQDEVSKKSWEILQILINL